MQKIQKKNMNPNLKVPFARTRDRVYRRPSEVDKADGPFHCMCCEADVLLRKGTHNVHHFSHRPADSECEKRNAGDAAYAKHVIAKNLSACVIRLACATCGRGIRRIAFEAGKHCTRVDGAGVIVTNKSTGAVVAVVDSVERVVAVTTDGADTALHVQLPDASGVISSFLGQAPHSDARIIVQGIWTDRPCTCTVRKTRSSRCRDGDGRCYREVAGACCRRQYARMDFDDNTCSCDLLPCVTRGCEEQHPLWKLKQHDMQCENCHARGIPSVVLGFGKHNGCYTNCSRLPATYVAWLAGWKVETLSRRVIGLTNDVPRDVRRAAKSLLHGCCLLCHGALRSAERYIHEDC